MKQQLLKASTTDTVEIKVWDHNVQVVPTAALVSIVIDSTVEVSLATATITSLGTCSYIPGATVLDDVAENCMARWYLTVGGVTQHYDQLFDVVLHKLYPVVTDEDLIAECAQLQFEKYLESALADSGTTSTLVSTKFQDYPDDYFKGGLIEITEGENVGLMRVILSNDKATGTVNFDTSMPSAITASCRFVARRTFQREIDRAWEDIEALIVQRGYRPALVMNAEDLKPLHVAATLVKISKNLAKTTEDIWWARAGTFEEDREKRLKGINFVYDNYEDELPTTMRTFLPGFRR